MPFKVSSKQAIALGHTQPSIIVYTLRIQSRFQSKNQSKFRKTYNKYLYISKLTSQVWAWNVFSLTLVRNELWKFFCASLDRPTATYFFKKHIYKKYRMMIQDFQPFKTKDKRTQTTQSLIFSSTRRHHVLLFPTIIWKCHITYNRIFYAS